MNKLDFLTSLRGKALSEGNADAWRDYDMQIRAELAYLRAEVKLGRRDAETFRMVARA
jgi:hypothetical protein